MIYIVLHISINFDINQLNNLLVRKRKEPITSLVHKHGYQKTLILLL